MTCASSIQLSNLLLIPNSELVGYTPQKRDMASEKRCLAEYFPFGMVPLLWVKCLTIQGCILMYFVELEFRNAQLLQKLQVFGALFRGVALKVNDWSMLFRGEDSPNHKPPSNRDEVTTALVAMKFIQRSGILS